MAERPLTLTSNLNSYKDSIINLLCTLNKSVKFSWPEEALLKWQNKNFQKSIYPL